jgi:NitT/TauT family transport system ATP-binding protein
MIKINSLTFGYLPNAPLFQNFDLRIERGETWAVLGSSGCGKTTLLYLLSGLKFPNAGEIIIDGEALTRPRPRTGLILQDYGLLPWASVRENIELGMRVRDFYGPDGKHTPRNYRPSGNLTEYWIRRLGLEQAADQFPGQISGGQRQRTAIARTLALQPDLLLMDEPFSSLDAITREDLQTLTLNLCAENDITLVIVTHAIEDAAALGKKILLLQPAPNTAARIFKNPRAGEKDYINAEDYRKLCNWLRREMQNETA